MISLKESLLDTDSTINNDESLIRQFIEDNYIIDGTYTIKNGVFNGSKTVIVDVDGDVGVENIKIKSLITNGLFRWGIIKGYFDCSGCKNLISLEGGPKECKDFNCNYCNNLKSLEGAPEKCKDFYCNNCKNLISLEGAPKECRDFYCNFCKNLISLEGAPTECNAFYCIGCDKLPNKSELKRLYPQYKYIHH